MAGDPIPALALVGLGIRSLSMGANSLPAVRRAIREESAGELARQAAAACDTGSVSEARARFAR